MSDYNDGYDDFLNEAAKDDRIGKHRGMIVQIVEGTWEARDGEPARPYTNISFSLNGGGSIDMRWSEPPEKAPTKEEMAGMDKGRRMGIVNAVNLRRQLAQHFSKNFKSLKVGDELGLLIEPQKSKKDGKSYPRVRAFVPLEECDKGAVKSDDQIPF